ncbi:Hypothetical protein CINCED_3A018788 [Cinara cedri]|uniref:Uncharacterized protein n=1 Tax=Cinara cedri TaxID=506608 RepID=A0A5E4NJR5_9HEMI|nr:Hypothetical protein CINCED_3A018788 [Cinara cedri]
MINNSPTLNSIIIALFNANGLKNHVNELQAVLYEKRIDIVILDTSSENWLELDFKFCIKKENEIESMFG